MAANEQFTVNGMYYDWTSLEWTATQGLITTRASRELKDLTFNDAMTGIAPIFGTSAKTLGFNHGRAEVQNPSMTMTLEAWMEIQSSPIIQQRGVRGVEFNFTATIKAKLGQASVKLNFRGCSFIGRNPQGWNDQASFLGVQIPMVIRECDWSGVPLVR